MIDENKRYVEEFANPHAWMLMADNLHEQATEIYQRRTHSSMLTKLNAQNEVVAQTRGIDKSVFLLGGFALENALKAFLVFENPSWVSNGRLSRNLRTHSLVRLQQESQLVPYKKRYGRVLRAFESGLDSHFRYPCALTVQETKQEAQLFEDLWQDYQTVMRAYSKKLRRLFNTGWHGPHGTYGRWILDGDFLGSGKPLMGLARATEHPSRMATYRTRGPR